MKADWIMDWCSYCGTRLVITGVAWFSLPLSGHVAGAGYCVSIEQVLTTFHT